ncbi:MAG: RsmE family RNA methyltransferase [Phycisphaerales bacterium]
MSRHTLMVEPGTLTAQAVGAALIPDRAESDHAVRVKRLIVGERVTLLDGAGLVGAAVVSAVRPGFELRIESVREEPPVTPRVEVWSATPKGPRLEDMIDQLSQVGAALWRPLDTEYGVVEPGEHKIERCRRVAREAAKQCGRAWLMEIGEAASIEQALTPRTGTMLVVADARGPVWGGVSGSASCVRVLVGPEGGFSAGELERAAAAGATPIRLGPHVLRIETAAVCAAGRIVGG